MTKFCGGYSVRLGLYALHLSKLEIVLQALNISVRVLGIVNGIVAYCGIVRERERERERLQPVLPCLG